MNKASIVGENGPELFVPRSAGTIVPNGQLGSRSQPTQQTISNTYVTNNISAVDAAGVAKLFIDNRRQLLGAVNQADKEMPTPTRTR
jgi:hypothetical protein